MRYRKKPVEVEVVRWDGNPDLWNDRERNKLLIECYEQGNMTVLNDSLYINTLEGVMEAKPGDYIIKGIKGEFYPCKPDIFEQTYEKVD